MSLNWCAVGDVAHEVDPALPHLIRPEGFGHKCLLGLTDPLESLQERRTLAYELLAPSTLAITGVV